MKQRTLYFDVIRVLSCIMIVFMHAQKDGVGTSGWLLAGSGYVEAAGIGLFFMISGALTLMSKSDRGGKLCAFTYLKRRIGKIAVPLLAWFAIYSLTSYWEYECTGRGVLWFLWTIGGLYLLSPILIRWLQNADDKEILLYLGVWGVSLLYPVVNLFLTVSPTDTSWIYYFHGYVGYFVLGYYLCHRVNSFSRIAMIFLCVAFFLIAICAPLAVLFLHIEVNFFDFFWYLSIPVVLQCVVWFLCMKRLESWLQSWNDKSKNALQWVSSQTFGIYLVHILIMRGWLWKTEWIQSLTGVTHMVVCAIITFCLAMCVTALIRKVPYLRMIVGG